MLIGDFNNFTYYIEEEKPLFNKEAFIESHKDKDFKNFLNQVVINYDMSGSAEAYVHRVGRAGRFGTKGITITFLSKEEDQKVFDELLQKYPNIKAAVLPEEIDKSIYSK